jgi:hypothetical protein
LGLGFGLVAPKLRGPSWVHGLALGTSVWASAYAVLPALGIYKPATDYPARTLAIDLGRHLEYGLTVSTADALLTHD